MAAGSRADGAIAWPPGRGPVLIASYTDGAVEDMAVRNTIHAAIARAVAGAFA